MYGTPSMGAGHDTPLLPRSTWTIPTTLLAFPAALHKLRLRVSLAPQ